VKLQSLPVRAMRFALGLLSLTAPAAVLGQSPTVVERYDFSRRSGRFDLPGRLDEISGLAIAPDGRLFGHDDERAIIYEIDTVEESLGKRFSLGDPPIRGDFEGIAIVGDRFFLVTSAGILYEFREVEDRADAPYRVSDTRLGAVCEVEGLDYDALDDTLLIACKVATPRRGPIVVHRLPMDPGRGALEPIRISRSDVAAHGLDADFAPSALAVDPTGTMLLASAPFESLLEVDRRGGVVAGIRLDRRRHPQPEGLAFAQDATLYIADERNGRDARITVYARRGSGGALAR